jgi:hypothetical protein
MTMRAILALGGTVPLALACIASAADRRGTPLALLPPLLAPQASLEAARGAAIAGDPEHAMAAARLAISASPMDADAVALLGAGAMAAGNEAAAHGAFTVAAELGWRNPATQLYWLGVGLQVEDYPAAADRLDALLRIGERSPATDAAFVYLEASSQGRATLAQRLVSTPPWRDAFAASTLTLSGVELERRIAVLRQASAAGIPIGCRSMEQPTKVLFARGAYDASAELWFGTCGRTAHGGGFGFAAVRHDVPFEWQARSSGDMDVSFAPPPAPLRGIGLRVAVQGDLPRVIASRAVRLGPGGYSMNAGVVDDRGRPSQAVRVALTCLGSKPAGDARGTHALPALFDVPAASCTTQQLDLVVDPQRLGGTGVAWIGDVTIRAVKAAPGSSRTEQQQATTH